MYWLDGGHAGGSKTWITDHAVLKDIASLPNLGIHIHVSPYQVRDKFIDIYMFNFFAFPSRMLQWSCRIAYRIHLRIVLYSPKS